jgi:hypothetical protein
LRCVLDPRACRAAVDFAIATIAVVTTIFLWRIRSFFDSFLGAGVALRAIAKQL